VTERYLGDGLYASWDGFQVKLRAPRDGGDHEIYLEPGVFNEFVLFIEDTFNIRVSVGAKSGELPISAFIAEQEKEASV
jgi:hypothetical protein